VAQIAVAVHLKNLEAAVRVGADGEVRKGEGIVLGRSVGRENLRVQQAKGEKEKQLAPDSDQNEGVHDIIIKSGSIDGVNPVNARKKPSMEEPAIRSHDKECAGQDDAIEAIRKIR
jgi:hypothetical protein